MRRNTSISLGNHSLRAGLRLLEEEKSKIVALKNAIEEGFESGLAKSFNAKKHLEKLKAIKRK